LKNTGCNTTDILGRKLSLTSLLRARHEIICEACIVSSTVAVDPLENCVINWNRQIVRIVLQSSKVHSPDKPLGAVGAVCLEQRATGVANFGVTCVGGGLVHTAVANLQGVQP
jgi:hypothetical protein